MTVETHGSTDFTPSFEAEDDEVVQYRSVSPLAIVALLLGLASPLCVTAPLMMVIPFVGAMVAILALRRISESDGALAGRGAALAGLALCIAFSLAAITRTKVTEYLRSEQAASVAQQWFALLQSDQTEPAFRLTTRGAAPEPPPSPDMPANTPAKDPLQEFLGDPVVKAVQAAGQSATVRHADNLDYSASGGQIFISQSFVVTPPAGDLSNEAIDITLTMQRGRLGHERRLRWLVYAFKSDDLPASGDDVRAR